MQSVHVRIEEDLHEAEVFLQPGCSWRRPLISLRFFSSVFCTVGLVGFLRRDEEANAPERRPDTAMPIGMASSNEMRMGLIQMRKLSETK